MIRFIPFLILILAGSAFAAVAPPEIAGVKPAVLVADDIKAFKPFSANATQNKHEIVPVEGQPFSSAARLTAAVQGTNYWDYGMTVPNAAAVKKGDVLWLSLSARRVATRKESGEAQAELVLEQPSGAGAGRVRQLERSLSFGPEWTTIHLPFAADRDAAAGAARLGVRYGHAVQTIEVGGITLLNYGPNVKLTDLPQTIIRYDGYAPDSPWRKAAAERIEKIRKSDLTVHVTDSSGQPVPEASVSVRMKRHTFTWGAQIDANDIILDTPDAVKNREIVEKYFNQVVFGNDMKWNRWINQSRQFGRSQTLAALPWLAERDISVRGHVLVWPSWSNLPRFLRQHEKDPATLRKAVSDHITEQTTTLSNKMADWDVVNETYRHHDLLDLLGRDIMVEWFKLAKAGSPQSRLFYNDYTLFHGNGPGSPSAHFFDTIQFLKKHGAPVDAIGEQGHFGGSPPGPPEILAKLDHFATLGLPIVITEFDIDTADLGLQADFVRDFTTATFSHPAVTGFVNWGIWEGTRGKNYSPKAALWDLKWNLRPHGKVFLDLIDKTWRTQEEGSTAANGNYTTRGFHGTYQIIATHDGRTGTIDFRLAPGTQSAKVILP